MESKLRTMPSKRSSILHHPRALQAGLLHLPHKRLKTTLPQPHLEEHASNFVAKDLRIKRIFSPNLQNRSSVSSRELISDRERLITANRTCSNEDSGVGNTHVECDEDGRCDGKSEEPVHSTPPDVDILTGAFVSASSSGCPRSSNGGVLGDTCVKSDCRIDSVARPGSVLRPCSKRKLFKAPGSIAYKRLLPFLMDNDNYKLQDDPNPKSENNLVKKVNNESDLRNHVKGSSFLDSDTCVVKNATFASGLSSKTMKLNLPPPDDGDASNFQNGGDLNNSQNTIKEDSGLKKDNAVCASSLDVRLTEQSKNPGIETIDGGSTFVSEVDNFMSHVSEDIKRDGHFNEELKMSSLNSNIVDSPLNEERRDEKVGCTRGADQKLGSSTVGENHCSIATESDKKNGACVRNKMVRNPLVQLKSKYSQVSFSYRRMRPFLEDLFKDNPENCASGNIDCSVPEKELPTMNLQPPSSNSHNSQVKSEGLVSCNMPLDGNSYTPSMHELTSKNETDCETDKVLLPAGVDDKLLSPPKLTLQSEQEMLDKFNLKTDPQLPGATFLNDQAVSPLYPAANYETLIGEGSRMTSEQSPITSEDCTSLKDSISDGANISERNSLAPNSSSVEGGILPGIHINHRKGILKRNTRGCRGICNCLNCSSFRLHAERAFEFSRNQLEDAEEVASDLMKELSYLRGVLEKYSDGAKGDAGHHHSNKVKEACRKASEAELIAKDRLQQMNYELNIHCRITCSQRPNVRFSSEVEKLEIEDGK